MPIHLLTHRSAVMIDPAAAGQASESPAAIGSALAVASMPDGPFVVRAYAGEEVPDEARTRQPDEVGFVRLSSGSVALASDDGRTVSAAAVIEPGVYAALRWHPTYPPGFIAARAAAALNRKEREALGAMNVFIFTTFGTFLVMAVLRHAVRIDYVWGYLAPMLVGLVMITWARRVHRRGDATYEATMREFPSVVIQLTRVERV